MCNIVHYNYFKFHNQNTILDNSCKMQLKLVNKHENREYKICGNGEYKIWWKCIEAVTQ